MPAKGNGYRRKAFSLRRRCPEGADVVYRSAISPECRDDGRQYRTPHQSRFARQLLLQEKPGCSRTSGNFPVGWNNVQRTKILSSRAEPRDLGTDWTANVNEMRRSFDSLRSLRMTALCAICTTIVGRGLAPADQVKMIALVKNDAHCTSSRCVGAVMTAPYDTKTISYQQQRKDDSNEKHSQKALLVE